MHVETRRPEPISPRREIIYLEGYVIAKKAAEDTGVVVAQLAGPGEKYSDYKKVISETWPLVQIKPTSRVLPEDQVAVIISGDIDKMHAFQRQRHELTMILLAKETPEGQESFLAEAKAARSKQEEIREARRAEVRETMNRDLLDRTFTVPANDGSDLT
ncbi:MAG TPA: hypothetical protein VNA13_03850 [Xanthomonadales bacterium]|nr:hypothetical protein [Xanthomonadales bacterium]